MGQDKMAGFEMNENMMKMLGGFTLIRLTGLLGMTGVKFTREQLLELNSQLNQIKK
jgi:beta-galactosidase